MSFIKYIPYIYIGFKYLSSYEANQNEKTQKTFFLIWYCLMYLSFVFTGQNSIHLAMRFENTSMLPFSFFLVSYIKSNKGSNVVNTFIYLALISFIVPLIVFIIKLIS